MPGVAIVEPLDVGEQDHQVRPHAGGDQRRQAVVVAHLDLVDRHRVVLVHHRDDAAREEGLEGVAGVQEALAAGQVVGGEEHLGDDAPVGAERPPPLGHEVGLAHRGGGLLGGDVPGLPGRAHQAEPVGAERDGARGDEHHAAGPAEQGELGGEPLAVPAVESSGRVGEGAGSDLDDEAAGLSQGSAGHGDILSRRAPAGTGRGIPLLHWLSIPGPGRRTVRSLAGAGPARLPNGGATMATRGMGAAGS